MGSTALRVGVLTPHAAPGPEVELPAMAPGRVTTTLVRIGTDDPPPSSPTGLRALAAPSTVDSAAAPLRGGAVDAVAYASTSSAYVIGSRAEAALVEGLRRSCGVPVASSGSAAVAALRTYGSGRVVVVHPPWIAAEVDELGLAYFRDQGFAVSLVKVDGIPADPAAVRPEHVVDRIPALVGAGTDPVFLGGNGFRAAAAVEELERRTGRLVLEANQVLLWSVLAATGTRIPVTGHGRLLAAASGPVR